MNSKGIVLALSGLVAGCGSGGPDSSLDPGEESAEAASALLPSIVLESGPINFGGGVPVGGWANLSVFPDGNYNFSGHFHDSGATSYDVNVVWGLRSSDGSVFVFTAAGRVHGTFESGSRNFDWNHAGNYPAMASDWAALSSGWSARWSSHTSLNVGGSLEDVKNGLGAAGAVVAIVAAL